MEVINAINLKHSLPIERIPNFVGKSAKKCAVSQQ